MRFSEPMRSLRERLAGSAQAFRAVFRNPNLRRIELAWIGSETGKWLYIIALWVYAYEAGGAAAVGLVTLIRTASSALASPFTSVLGDRYRRERVMLLATLGRTLAMAAAAFAVFVDSPAAVVYALTALVVLMSTAFRPAQAALLPSLARSPEELTAANVASSTIASIGSFAGAAFGGLLVAATSTEVVFAATAGTFLWAALLVSGIRVPASERAAATEARARLRHEALEGFRTILAEPNVRLINLLYGGQTLVAGALSVLIVVAALELLELGESGVGFLNSAFGIGGLVGAPLAALALVGGRRLATGFTFGLALWGLPLLLVGVWPEPAAALVLFALIGVGDTLVDVSALTLLQRAVPDEVLARVFGALETLLVTAMGLGAILAPLVVELLGARGALIAVGALLPIVAGLFALRLRAIDAAAVRPERELELLSQVPIFAGLAPPVLEPLAGELVPVRVGRGEEVVREGDRGDRFYVVGEGELDVTVDGRGVRTLTRGDYFGEIALLRDVPRTATVTARTDAELYALDRDDFIGAVTGHARSREAADAVIATRLATARTSAAYD